MQNENPIETPSAVHLKDYTPPDWLIDSVRLDVDIRAEGTLVTAVLACLRNPVVVGDHPLLLDGHGGVARASQDGLDQRALGADVDIQLDAIDQPGWRCVILEMNGGRGIDRIFVLHNSWVPKRAFSLNDNGEV